MRFVDEYRDPELCAGYAGEIHRAATRGWTLMEVCGGQTHTIMRYGIGEMIADSVELIHGPGCPVCVTPVSHIDAAVEIASTPGVALCTFGDMLRVPGSRGDLNSARARGGDVRMVYSPFDAVELAAKNPDTQVVMFAVGFETTAPATAAALLSARELRNFSVLCCHVLVPPAMEAVLSMEGCGVQGFLAAGHVCTVTGWKPYSGIADRYGVPIVVAGFEPADILQAVLMCVGQLEKGTHRVENQYTRSVSPHGNPAALAMMSRVFVTEDRDWRGLGVIPRSGLNLAMEWKTFDALERFGVSLSEPFHDNGCLAGRVLTGGLSPPDCPRFGFECTPDTPLGAPMVSSEGACAAHYRYGRTQ
jgi:hydrogenase expression/formation protein HypD